MLHPQSISRIQFYAKGVSLAGILLLLSTCAGDEVVAEQARVAASPSSKWCMIGNTRVHYLDVDRADSDRNLLIVHGYLGSTVSFLELIDDLSSDIRVVMPDLPVSGASEVPECGCTMEYYIDFLESFVQATGLERYYPMGTSMGANIAAHYATKHRGQVQGSIFLSPFGLHDQAGRMTRIRGWDALLPLATSLVTRRGVERRLPRIEQPVLILIGSEDKLISPEDRERFRVLLADGQLEIIEESGHFLYLDSPDVVSQKIVTFTRGGME